jgi:hypothetical protein
MGYQAITKRLPLGRLSRRRRLGQDIYASSIDPSGDTSFFYPAAGPSTTNNNPLPRPAACSWYDYIWPTEACSLALGQQQIQQVAVNAASAGYPADVVAATQAAADEQSAGYAADNAVIFNPPIGPQPSTWPWYYWALLAGGVFLAIESVARK